ncbi:MAG: hypothetical protein HYX83_01235, partial [Chloroflexi bacterium]|nr:hypothetical protein [Chloroflexota bacterium]
MGLQKRLTLYGAIGLIALTGFLAVLAISTVSQVSNLIYEERLDRAREIAQEVSTAFAHVRQEAERSASTIGQAWQTSALPFPQILSSLHGHLRQHLATVHSLEPPLFVGIANVDGKVLWAEPYWGERLELTVPDIAESIDYRDKAILSRGAIGLSTMIPILDSQQQRQGYLIVEIVPLAGSFDSFLQLHSRRYQLQLILSDSGAVVSSSVSLEQEKISPDWEVIRPLALSYQAGLIKHHVKGDGEP